MTRVILHVDLNSFFATAEQQTNPALRGKPVGIIKAYGRSCVIAASVEAKKCGVKTGSNVYDAKKLCPQINFVVADFDKYADITYRFIDICKSYSPICEVFSLDECFIDVSESEKFWPRPPRNASIEHLAWFEMGKKLRGGASGGNVFNIAFGIKRRIREEIGDYITCSIGVSHNRLLAKLASSRVKLDGLFWITEDNVLKVLDEASLMDVCGLGFRLYERLTALGIDNFPKLRECSLSFLHKHFGPFWSKHLYNIARGVDASYVLPINNIADAKSVGRTYTTHKLLNNKNDVYKLARNLCEEATVKARKMNLAGRYVGFFLRTSARKWSGEEKKVTKSWYGHRTLKNYIDTGKEFFDICKLISKDWEFENIIFCGVTLGMLSKKEYVSLPIFENDVERENLIKALDRVNNKFGDYTLFPSQLLGMPIIMPEVTGYFGDKVYYLRNTF